MYFLTLGKSIRDSLDFIDLCFVILFSLELLSTRQLFPMKTADILLGLKLLVN